ncbi:hypothetical protein ACJIZ3_002047 [Penstemon smallii]|uniref:Uncharacterized protein n=1 Tax=Penstemon smallii TaxID=265156 RepID=A0ABD3U5C3_9LAMI
MSEVAAAPSCRNSLFRGGAYQFEKYPHKQIPKWQCKLLRVEKKLRQMKLEAQMVNPSTYSSRISTDIPLYEIPTASFDEYLEDKPRVFKAIFPDKRRSRQLNEEEWRVHMLPIEFLFLTVLPVIDMRLRCKSDGVGYPPGVPRDITKTSDLLPTFSRNDEKPLFVIQIRWELQGLDDMVKPSQFSLGVKGSLYPDRRGPRIRLKGHLQMSISFVLPPLLSLVPDDIRRDVAESVLKRLVENMKDKVNGSLIADYTEFKKQRSKAVA